MDASFASQTAILGNKTPISSRNLTAVQISPGIGAFNWTIDAQVLIANWTFEKYREVGRPPDFSGREYATKISETSGQESYNAATGHASSRNLSALVAFTDGHPIQFNSSMQEVSLKPALGDSLLFASNAPSLDKNVPLAAGSLEASGLEGLASIRGNFSVYLAEENVTIRAAGQEHTYQSGNWTEAIAPYPVGPYPPARYRYYQATRLDVFDGTLTVQSLGHPTKWLMKGLEADGNFSATFDDAVGSATSDGRPHALSHERFAASGFGQLRAWNETGSTQRLRTTIVMTAGTLSAIREVPIDLVKQGPDPAKQSQFEITRPAESSGLLWLAFSAIALIPLAFLLARKIDPRHPDLVDVEWAILTGASRRALRWSRRLVRHEPTNPDGLFLYGSQLLVSGLDHEITRHLEPLAEAVPQRLRTGIAYVLAVSARRVGDAARARRWALEASQEPTLRRRMEGDGAWDAVLSVSGQRGEASPAYA